MAGRLFGAMESATLWKGASNTACQKLTTSCRKFTTVGPISVCDDQCMQRGNRQKGSFTSRIAISACEMVKALHYDDTHCRSFYCDRQIRENRQWPTATIMEHYSAIFACAKNRQWQIGDVLFNGAARHYFKCW